MVVFHDDPRKYDTPEVMQRIQHEVTCVLELHKLIAQKEEAIMLNSNVSDCHFEAPSDLTENVFRAPLLCSM